MADQKISTKNISSKVKEMLEKPVEGKDASSHQEVDDKLEQKSRILFYLGLGFGVLVLAGVYGFYLIYLRYS